ncbi:MAG: GGDEF domain-containing protein [Pirellulaceae bacterium]|nr:GGDEF domain-containing protein [Pirellulaceae bacterium]MDP7018809.1 GGDEF domain-containing protein [Pirellulaceae bacterium]
MSAESTAEPPATVHCDTRLDETWVYLADHEYVLATDDEGSIVGVVPSSRIIQRLESANDRERARWEGMPLSALIQFSIGHAADSCVRMEDSHDCIAITENDDLIGLSLQGDVFFSWRRLEPTLASASCDPLTGLMNRLAYERRLSEEWSRAERCGTSVAVVVVDLDDFKGVNDQYGHQTGDIVLKKVARALEASLRSYDVVARFGGDEFVALCLGCHPGDIDIPLQRIEQHFRGCSVEHQGAQLPIRCSIGAAVRHDGFSNTQPAGLFAAADGCLYQAKRTFGDPHVVELGKELDGKLRRVLRAESSPAHEASPLNEGLAQ